VYFFGMTLHEVTPMTAIVLAAALSWPAIVQQIEKGNAASDPVVLRTAAGDAEKLADVTGDEHERQLALLGAAYANAKIAFLPGVSEAETMEVLKHADKLLAVAIKADSGYAEAYALRAAVLGSMIRAGGNTMELGPEASEALDTALRLAPNNPRVLLQAAVNTMHVPLQYGGGTDKAEPMLRRALAAFDREPANRPWPNWGRFDAHVWLGQILAQRGDKAGARAEYDAALHIVPDSGWVKFKLLPQLDRK
jgi:tetratricopeptide (TPR) repeat protein